MQWKPGVREHALDTQEGSSWRLVAPKFWGSPGETTPTALCKACQAHRADSEPSGLAECELQPKEGKGLSPEEATWTFLPVQVSLGKQPRPPAHTPLFCRLFFRSFYIFT